MQEEWRDVVGYEGIYMISNLGRVSRILRGGKLSGYPSQHLRKQGFKIFNALVHRLVAEAFILNPGNKPEVNHLNGDIMDARAINLARCTHSENLKHSFKHLNRKPAMYYRKLKHIK